MNKRTTSGVCRGMLLLAAALALFPGLSGAGEVAAADGRGGLRVNLDKGVVLVVPTAGKPGGERSDCPVRAVPELDGAKGFKVAWDPARSKYIELLFKEPLALPDASRMTVRARFHAPEGCPVHRLGLRLADKSGEIYQYPREVAFRNGGRIEAVWDVAPGAAAQHWGGDKNGRFDAPGRLRGFGVDYRAADARPAEFHLLSVEAEFSGGAPETAARPLYRFDRNDRFSKQGAGTLAPGESGLLWHGIDGSALLSERMDALVPYPLPPAEIRLALEPLAGAVDLHWVFRDKANKEIRSPVRTASPGVGELVFPLGDAFAGTAPPYRLQGLRAVKRGDVPGTLLFKNADLAVRQPLVEALDFDVFAGTGIRVLKKGFENALALDFANRSGRPGRFVCEVEFVHYSGERGRETVTLELAPGQTARHAPTWRPTRFGHWDVHATVREASTPEASGRRTRSFAYLEPAGPTEGRAGGFLFGMNSHPERWSPADQEREMEAAALCGVKVLRGGPGWGGVQPAPDRWHFDDLDRLVDGFGRVGIELQMLLAYTPKWAASPEAQQAKAWRDWARSRPDPDAWRVYARTLAQRYRDRIRFWEVWNEPDLQGFNRMSLEEYLELQRNAFAGIKEVAPEAVVMSGGFATVSDHPGKKSPTFQREYLEQARGRFEIHLIHEHGSFANYVARTDGRFLPLRRETGTRVPWWANETGITSLGGAERLQATTLFKKLLFAWSRGAIGYSWYDLRNDGYDAREGEHNYGLMTTDFQPKPAYSVHTALARRYRGARFDRQLDAGVNRWAFVFAGPEGLLLPAWSEEGAGGALALALRSDAAEAELVDLMGNVRAVPMAEGLAPLDLRDEPATLRLRGATRVELLPPLVHASGASTALPGRPYTIAAKLRNPLPSSRRFQVRLEMPLPEGLAADDGVREISVPPGAEAEVALPLRVDKAFHTDPGRPATLRLAYTVDGTPWRGTMGLAVHSATAVPAGGGFDRTPDFVLDRQSQVVPLTAADPALGHRVWSGPEDLSARVFLAFDGATWRLRVEAVDDKHCQPHTGNAAWRGDSVQFAFSLPGQDGYWEVSLARRDDGGSEAHVALTPRGFDAGGVSGRLSLETAREGDRTVYDLRLPAAAVGLTPEAARDGFPFNLLVNDNDGEGRDGWIHIAPGLGESKDPARFPYILFMPE